MGITLLNIVRWTMLVLGMDLAFSNLYVVLMQEIPDLKVNSASVYSILVGLLVAGIVALWFDTKKSRKEYMHSITTLNNDTNKVISEHTRESINLRNAIENLNTFVRQEMKK